MELTPEQAAIGVLFAALNSFAGLVIRELWHDNKLLRERLEKSNDASRDLIAIQASMLREKGIIFTQPPAMEDDT